MMLSGVLLGCVWLQVADLQRSLEFYQWLGFRVGIVRPPVAVLTTANPDEAILLLIERSGAPPQPSDAVGLYHVAFLLPSEQDLAEFLLFALQQGIPLEGASDHRVSQALYLSDPDGNGIEIYADRPRQAWELRLGEVWMTTEPLDIRRLLQVARQPWRGMPEGTRVGHVHFRVASLEEAEAFLSGVLGFAVTLRSYPGARFFAADGYHHHVGANTWGRPTRMPPREAAGIRLWSLGIGEATWQEQREHWRRHPAYRAGDDAWVLLHDPWGSSVLLARLSALPRTPEAVFRMFNQLREVLP